MRRLHPLSVFPSHCFIIRPALSVLRLFGVYHRNGGDVGLPFSYIYNAMTNRLLFFVLRAFARNFSPYGKPTGGCMGAWADQG